MEGLPLWDAIDHPCALSPVLTSLSGITLVSLSHLFLPLPTLLPVFHGPIHFETSSLIVLMNSTSTIVHWSILRNAVQFLTKSKPYFYHFFCIITYKHLHRSFHCQTRKKKLATVLPHHIIQHSFIVFMFVGNTLYLETTAASFSFVGTWLISAMPNANLAMVSSHGDDSFLNSMATVQSVCLF